MTLDTITTSPREAALVDLGIWRLAPRESTPAYFPVYSRVSLALQGALRQWVSDWVFENPQILQKSLTAQSLLVYASIGPFKGRPPSCFTYDIQRNELDLAFASAAKRLEATLEKLDTRDFRWCVRERFFPYRARQVVRAIAENHRIIYRLLNVETRLMDGLLKYALIDLPEEDPVRAADLLRRTCRTQLRRFSYEFDFRPRVEELLGIASDALLPVSSSWS